MTTTTQWNFFSNSIDAMLSEIEALANAAAFMKNKALETELRAMYAAGQRALVVSRGRSAEGVEVAEVSK